MSTPSNRGTAIVTGASSGIGAVYADRLADRGYDLVLVARGRERLVAQAAGIAARTGRNVEARLRTDQALTLLVNNAGIAEGGPLAVADPSDLELMIDLNVVALTRLSAAAAAAFTARKAGAIINLSSGLALLSTPNTAAYGATKAYVLHFSRGLADEVTSQGVQVQAVLPGWTRTPMLSDDMLASIPSEMIMPVDDLVDAALAGFDRGELVTIPSLPDIADWEAFEAARARITQGASRDHPAARYAKAA